MLSLQRLCAPLHFFHVFVQGKAGLLSMPCWSTLCRYRRCFALAKASASDEETTLWLCCYLRLCTACMNSLGFGISAKKWLWLLGCV